jgi:hypothetical protein
MRLGVEGAYAVGLPWLVMDGATVLGVLRRALNHVPVPVPYDAGGLVDGLSASVQLRRNLRRARMFWRFGGERTAMFDCAA